MNTSLYGGLIEISPDGQPITPDLVLSYRGGTKQGIIHNVQSLTNANALVETAEISFDVYKEIDGVECQLWDDLRDFRLVYIPHLDTSTFNPWYELSVEVDENDCTIKHCQGVHLQEAELGQLTLNGVEINTEDDIARDDYSPTIIYDPKNPEASALDRILKDKASHYTVVHVDSSIANLQRTFSWDGSSIKDAFDDIANEVECLFKYGEYTNNDGKIHRTISVYDLNDRCMECGERGSFTTKVCPKCGSANVNYGYGTDSGIFLSHENFAGDITYSSNKDSVKNCFRLVAGDDLMTATIRNINPSGSQYIWYLSDSVRADMSQALQDKLKAYDTEYESYSTKKQIDIPSTVIADYNALINKYKLYDDTLTNVKYPIIGYSALTDVYYSALNFYSLLKTTLAPASEHGEKTTAAKELAKLTTSSLSPLGIQNAEISSSATVTSAVQNYAKVFIDTSLYRITAKCNIYEAKVWKGTITLTGYSNDDDTATSAELTVYVSDATPDFIKCQIEKAMKKNEVDATGTVALFKKSESDFKQALSFYSVDNLNILASIARGCLDILIQQGVADPENELYSSMYLPYYNRSVWIQDELREREAEVLKLRGTRSNPDGVLDYIEKQRQTIANKLDLRSYLGEALWVEFCSFRRDDTYQNDNFISDGLSDTELIAQAKEFIKNAEREIVKSATLQHTISCNLNNFLLVKEQDVEESPVPIVTLDGIHIITHDQLYLVKGNATFSPLLVNFEVGNWVHIEIDGVVYKLRLTSYKIDYDNLDKLDVEFSDVTYGLDYMSDTQSILAQAQSMATSYSMVQHQANKGNNANKQIMDMVENGLNLTNKRIVNAADNQNMVVDESGLLMREKNEFGDDYSAEQTKIINHGFYYTNDGWKTVKTGLGKYIYYDPETGTYKEDYGIIAQKIVGNIILGNELGIYNTSGSVKIDQNGMTITADASDTNKDLFTLQRKNEDGSYTKYVYVDDDGNIKIDGRHIQMSAGEDIDDYMNGIKNELTSEINKKVETWYQDSDPSVNWTDKSIHEGDLWKDTRDNKEYIYRSGVWVEMAVPDEVFDQIDGKAQIFVNTPTPPYNVGDLWFDSASKDLLTCVQARQSGACVNSDWQKKTKYTDDSGLNSFVTAIYDPKIAELQSQIDGQIETWYYDYEPTLQNAPASSWSTQTEREKHLGDLFYWSSKGFAYRFMKDEATWKWQLVQDTDITKALSAAEKAQDTADHKRRVFVVTPQPPYDIGDLWTQGSTGDLMRCKVAKSASANFSLSDWENASKYTDDSTINNFIKDTYTVDIDSLRNQIDQKIETWFQTTDPSIDWTKTEKIKHEGDLWKNPDTGNEYIYRSGNWVEMPVPDVVFDQIDGKSSVYVTQPTTPYNVGDLWFTGSEIMTCVTNRTSGQFVGGDWRRNESYTDDSGLNKFVNTEYAGMAGKVNNLDEALAKANVLIQNNTKAIAEVSERDFSWEFKEITKYIDQVNGDLVDYKEEIGNWMRFDKDGYLTLGAQRKPGQDAYELKLTKNRISFMLNDAEVAYISNNELYITNSTVVQNLKIGRFVWEVRGNGNMGLVWR